MCVKHFEMLILDCVFRYCSQPSSENQIRIQEAGLFSWQTIGPRISYSKFVGFIIESAACGRLRRSFYNNFLFFLFFIYAVNEMRILYGGTQTSCPGNGMIRKKKSGGRGTHAPRAIVVVLLRARSNKPRARNGSLECI